MRDNYETLQQRAAREAQEYAKQKAAFNAILEQQAIAALEQQEQQTNAAAANAATASTTDNAPKRKRIQWADQAETPAPLVEHYDASTSTIPKHLHGYELDDIDKVAARLDHSTTHEEWKQLTEQSQRHYAGILEEATNLIPGTGKGTNRERLAATRHWFDHLNQYIDDKLQEQRNYAPSFINIVGEYGFQNFLQYAESETQQSVNPHFTTNRPRAQAIDEDSVPKPSFTNNRPRAQATDEDSVPKPSFTTNRPRAQAIHEADSPTPAFKVNRARAFSQVETDEGKLTSLRNGIKRASGSTATFCHDAQRATQAKRRCTNAHSVAPADEGNISLQA